MAFFISALPDISSLHNSLMRIAACKAMQMQRNPLHSKENKKDCICKSMKRMTWEIFVINVLLDDHLP